MSPLRCPPTPPPVDSQLYDTSAQDDASGGRFHDRPAGGISALGAATMRPHAALVLCFGLLSIASAAHAEDLVALSGKQLYVQFCAACHGEQGRGDGPVSSSFRVEVPDLTLLARRHGGTYPRDLVERIIDGRHILGAHGARTMPIWGQEFNRSGIGDPDAEAGARIVILRLADYVWLLQRPANAVTVPDQERQ